MANFGKTAEAVVMGVLGVVGVYGVGTARVDTSSTLPTEQVAELAQVDDEVAVVETDTVDGVNIPPVAATGSEVEAAQSVVEKEVDETTLDVASEAQPIDTQATTETGTALGLDENRAEPETETLTELDAIQTQTDIATSADVTIEPNDANQSDPVAAKEAEPLVAPLIELSRIDGETAIISGVGRPNSEIVAKDQSGEIARGRTDSAGNFALSFDYVPPAEGAIMEVVTLDSAETASSPAAVTVLPNTDGAPVVAALTEDNVAIEQQSQTERTLSLGQVSYGGAGPVGLAGAAKPGSIIDVFVDGVKRGNATAKPDGTWEFPIEGLDEGTHEIALVDDTGTVSSQNIDIAQPQLATSNLTSSANSTDDNAAGGVSTSAVTTTEAGVSVVQAKIGATTYTVQRGDSLWRIARSRFGEGVRYVDIYDRNSGQIQDPDLIFPGQVFEIN